MFDMWTEEKLNDLLTEPSEALVEDMKRLTGDILVLGAGGEMGPTLCVLAKRAFEKAGNSSRIIAVSRFSGEQERQLLEENGVDTIQADLLDPTQRAGLPQAENVIYIAGRKFGTANQEWETWAMNASLSGVVAEQYKESRIVVFSSGNVYPLCSVYTAGCSEEVPPAPIGEYAMSCLARERAFEFAANRYGIVIDLLTPYRFSVDGKTVEKRFQGGLLGHWSVCTKASVGIFNRLKAVAKDAAIPNELLTLAAEVTDFNAAVFDAKNGFAGCIPGVHEVLRRRGVMEGTWCLDPGEVMSPGQAEEIDRCAAM
ncbi:MAG: NAD-dependent epimerase/dehydratase family protein [Oscillospiraceae bacterium]|nr:NAD-dependent epimerase/dehydratase family protein [Oscillospiraceae bacterium]